jgi:CubicO group peptidase (beta-lactamase class C family)
MGVEAEGTGAAAARVAEELARGVEEGVFVGAQACVVGPGVDLDLCAGHTALPEYAGRTPVTGETRFDVASLTKAVCTTVIAMQAVAEGQLDLDAPLAEDFEGLPGAAQMSAALLLRHRAGLVAHRHFYRGLFEARRGADGLVPPVAAGDPVQREAFVACLAAEPLAAPPGSETIYSDPGFMLLGWLLEARLGERLDAAFARRVAAPLGLTRTSFGPVPPPVAATEVDENGIMLFGRVHDENARAVGGVAGHAGLFSTAREVTRVVLGLEADATGAGCGLAPAGVVERFWAPFGEERFTLGWDTPTGEVSSAGRYATRGRTVGHLGYAGCSVWHDRARSVTVTLLTNRVHPSRRNEAIKAYRPRFHDVVGEALFGGR